MTIDQGDLPRAIALSEEGAVAWRRLRAADPASVAHAVGLARSLDIRGIALLGQGYLKKADGSFREGLALRERVAREHPLAKPLTADLAWSHVHLGRVHTERDEFARAAERFSEAIGVIEKAGPDDGVFREPLREAYTARGELAAQREEYSDAERDFAKAVALADGPRQRELRIFHAILLAAIGKPDKAVEEVDAALDGDDLPPVQIFDAARALAIAADKETNPHRKERNAARAVQLLTDLIPTGYFRIADRRALLDKHPALQSLRGRTDFKTLREKVRGVLP